LKTAYNANPLKKQNGYKIILATVFQYINYIVNYLDTLPEASPLISFSTSSTVTKLKSP